MQLLASGLVQYIPWSKYITNTDTLVICDQVLHIQSRIAGSGGRERELVAHKRDTQTTTHVGTYIYYTFCLVWGRMSTGSFQTRFGQITHTSSGLISSYTEHRTRATHCPSTHVSICLRRHLNFQSHVEVSLKIG